ncbi:SLATT domain-containing protein [Kibdelosporangium lantanae]|uniref:SLATT domain-containing protein n=1 Tax=Kibdelosporangium lantanae TaxID=1497396 RepID=A0ABW3MB39_9PSEU
MNDDLSLRRWPGTGASLGELYEWAVGVGQDTIDWYMAEKERKARWSKALRAASVMLATLGGVVPAAALATGRPELGNWGFIILALAAGCLAYDRFFGYSSAWQRYMQTAMVLRARLVEFQLSWRRENDENLIHSFATTVNDIISAETDSWVAEFTKHLSEAGKTNAPHV